MMRRMSSSHYDLTILRQRKAALEDALYGGVSSVSVGGETTVFQSPADIRRAINDVDALLASLTGQPRRKPVVCSIRLENT